MRKLFRETPTIIILWRDYFMPMAFVLINTEIGSESEVLEELRKIDAILSNGGFGEDRVVGSVRGWRVAAGGHRAWPSYGCRSGAAVDVVADDE